MNWLEEYLYSLWKIQYTEYFRVKYYNGNSVRLQIISVCVKKYQL
jgi:hypothetical protein